MLSDNRAGIFDRDWKSSRDIFHGSADLPRLFIILGCLTLQKYCLGGHIVSICGFSLNPNQWRRGLCCCLTIYQLIRCCHNTIKVRCGLEDVWAGLCRYRLKYLFKKFDLLCFSIYNWWRLLILREERTHWLGKWILSLTQMLLIQPRINQGQHVRKIHHLSISRPVKSYQLTLM
jgi:hypothetical protein